MYHFNLAASVKYQLLNINTFPMYSYKLKKTVNTYIRYIRLHVPRRKHLLKSTIIDLFEIKKMLKKKMIEFSDYEIFENINDIVIATIITVLKIQHVCKFINDGQLSNYINMILSS